MGQGAKTDKNDDNKNDELEMLSAFSKENHEYNFDWDKYYSTGFNSINFKILSESEKYIKLYQKQSC